MCLGAALSQTSILRGHLLDARATRVWLSVNEELDFELRTIMLSRLSKHTRQAPQHITNPDTICARALLDLAVAIL